MTSVLLAMAPKVWMHKPDIPGLLVVRIVEKHSLSTSQIGPRQKKIPVKHSTNSVQNPGPSKAVTNLEISISRCQVHLFHFSFCFSILFQFRLASPSHFPPSPSTLLSFFKQDLPYFQSRVAAKAMQALALLPNHQLNCYRAFSWKCYRASAELLQSISGTATELIAFSPVSPYRHTACVH